jgi:drug/metabolite transporter (DMT)-like permease
VAQRQGADSSSTPVIAYVQLALAMMITGSHVVVGKLVVRSFPIFFASGTTLGLASLIFILLLLVKEGRFPRIGWRELGLLAAQAFTGLFIFRIATLKGLEYTGGIEAGIILSATPAVIGLISFTFLREKARWNKIAAVILAFIGILIINLSGVAVGGAPGTGSSATTSQAAQPSAIGAAGIMPQAVQPSGAVPQAVWPVLGSLLLFGSVLGEAFFTVIRKMLTGRISALANAAVVSSLGFLMLLPFTLSQIREVSYAQLGALQWVELLYYGTVVPLAAFLLWFSGVSRAQVNIAGVFTGFLSISALILSILILKEKAVWLHYVGLGLVLAGIALAVGITQKKIKLV